MAKGENIFKRKDGRWEARYMKGREASGKIKYGYCYGKTYRDAKEKAIKCKAAIINGNPIVSTRSQQRFLFYCDEWLHLRKIKVKYSTYVKYDMTLNKHIKPNLGQYFPTELTTELVNNFSQELLFEKGLSPKTVNDILVILRGIIKYVQTLLPGMPHNIEIIYPKIHKKEMRVLTKEEQEKFVSYLVENLDACKFGILLAFFTGIRIGELCALQWKNISLKDKTLHIDATMQRLRDMDENAAARTKIVTLSTKSENSTRIIPLLDFLVDLCHEMNPQNNSAYILTGTENYMEPRALQYRIKKYADACDLKDIHFHTLRHTFSTCAVEAGVEIKSLSEILGHASTSITLERYVHTTIKMKRDNMEKLKSFGFGTPQSIEVVKK